MTAPFPLPRVRRADWPPARGADLTRRACASRLFAALAAASLGACGGGTASLSDGVRPAATGPGSGTVREPEPAGPPASGTDPATPPPPMTVWTLPTDPGPGERVLLRAQKGTQEGAHWRVTPNPGQTILTDGLAGDVMPGERWVDIALDGAWSAAAASDDGRRLLVAANFGAVHLSSDEGRSWRRLEDLGEAHWTSVAIAPSAQHMAAASFDGPVWVSHDHGQTWTPRGEPRGWVSVALSESGSGLVGVIKNGAILTSDDGGETWIERSPAKRWQSVAATPDGKRIVAGASDGTLWFSERFGAVWTPLALQRPWSRLAIASDGQTLAAASWGSFVYLSNDAGGTWSPTFREGPVSALAMSGSGRRLLLTVPMQPGLPDGRPWLSLDGGLTWEAQGDDRTWMAGTVSGDGRTLLVAYTGPGTGGLRVSIGNRTSYGPAGSISGEPGGWLELVHEGDGRFRVVDADAGPHRVD